MSDKAAVKAANIILDGWCAECEDCREDREESAEEITRAYLPLVKAARDFLDAYIAGNETPEQAFALLIALRDVVKDECDTV